MGWTDGTDKQDHCRARHEHPVGSSRRPPSCPKCRFQGRARVAGRHGGARGQSARILDCPCQHGGFKVPRHPLPHSTQAGRPFQERAGQGTTVSSCGRQRQVDGTPPSTGESLLPPNRMSPPELPEVPGPWDSVSIVSPFSPAGPEIARFTQERRHLPWNYMQMSRACAYHQAAWQTQPG